MDAKRKKSTTKNNFRAFDQLYHYSNIIETNENVPNPFLWYIKNKDKLDIQLNKTIKIQ